MADEKNDVLLLPPSRRRFIATMLTVISGAIASILGVPLAGFFALPALRRPERRWLEVGPVSDFAQGDQKGWQAVGRSGMAYETPPGPSSAEPGRRELRLYYIHCTHVDARCVGFLGGPFLQSVSRRFR
jgi:hypothetical protein